MKNVRNITRKSPVRAPWTIVVIMRQYSISHRMGPVSQSSLSMDVPITTIATTLKNFLMSALIPVGNALYNAAVKIYAMKVTIYKRVKFWPDFYLILIPLPLPLPVSLPALVLAVVDDQSKQAREENVLLACSFATCIVAWRLFHWPLIGNYRQGNAVAKVNFTFKLRLNHSIHLPFTYTFSMALFIP